MKYSLSAARINQIGFAAVAVAVAAASKDFLDRRQTSIPFRQQQKNMLFLVHRTFSNCVGFQAHVTAWALLNCSRAEQATVAATLRCEILMLTRSKLYLTNEKIVFADSNNFLAFWNDDFSEIHQTSNGIFNVGKVFPKFCSIHLKRIYGTPNWWFNACICFVCVIIKIEHLEIEYL